MGSQLFGPLDRNSDIRVGYIDSDNGFVEGLSICEANEHAQKDPGTVFIFKSGNNVLQYLNINEVNFLTANDVLNTDKKCAGINQKVPIGPPKIVITGGGGVGAVGNPIVGIDGSLLAVDVVKTGHGYAFNPQVRASDDADFGGGAVLRSILGELVIEGDELVIRSEGGVSYGLNFRTNGTIRGYRGKNETLIYQYYDRADDYEEYFLCDYNPISYGRLWGPNGEDLGEWKPTSFIGGTDPILRDIQEFEKDVRALEGGFFNTRKIKPSKITSGDQNVRGSYHHVDDGPFVETVYGGNVPASSGASDPLRKKILVWYQQRWNRVASETEINNWIATGYSANRIAKEILGHRADIAGYIPDRSGVAGSGIIRWGNFMNNYAISPKPPSNARGSDFAGILFTFEWNLDFPTTGEYLIRGSKDNSAKLYIDNQFISNLDGFQATPTVIKKYYEEGLHTVKLELVNKPIYETTNIGAYETQVAGVDFIQKSDGIYMTVGGNDDVQVALSLKYDDNPKNAGTAVTEIRVPNSPGRPDLILTRQKEDKDWKEKGKVSSSQTFARSEEGYGPIIFKGSVKTPKLAKRNKAYGKDSIKYGVINLFDKDGDDVNAFLEALSTTNKQQSRPKKVVKGPDTDIITTEVFNTIDWINRANRKLWRTNVYNKGGFLNQYGVCPFDTSRTLENNPYAGTHDIRWDGIDFPADGNYEIEVEVDDSAVIYISNDEGAEVVIDKKGFKPSSDNSTGKSTYTRFFKKGKYRIRTELLQIPGGKFGFTGVKGTNPMALAVRISGSRVEVTKLSPKSWNQNPMGVALTIDAPEPTVPQEPAPVQDGRCPPNPIWTTRTSGAKEQWFPVTHSYRNLQSSSGATATPSGTNDPIRKLILTLYQQRWGRTAAEKEINDWVSTGYTANRLVKEILGHRASLAGYIPDRSAVTGSNSSGRTWSKFTNRYAISPIRPLAQEGTDGGGIVYQNSWTIQIPFDGYYGLKGTADNGGRVLIDGVEQIAGGLGFSNTNPRLGGFRENNPGTKKIFLTRGSHVIDVEVINQETVTYKPLKKKIFNSQEWASAVNQNKSVNVDFKVTTSAQFANSIKFGSGDGAEGFSFGKSYNGSQLNEQTTKRLETGKVYDVTFNSNRKSGGGNNLKLRNAGERTVQMEDYKDNDWADLVVTSSAGKFFDLQGNKAKFTVGASVSPSTVRKRNGATYSGPDLFRFNHKRWSKFMNKNNVSPFLPPFDTENSAIVGFFTYQWDNVQFSEDGRYRIRFQADNNATVFIDNQVVYNNKGFSGEPSPEFVNLKKGRYSIRVESENVRNDQDIFNSNPTGIALKIDTIIQIPNSTKPWKDNPIGISAILIAPPCPRRIDGRGIVTDIVIEDPGQGYAPPIAGPKGYPVLLKLKEVLVKNPGINYNCGVDQLIIEPSNGAELDYQCDTFGRIVKIKVINPGLGFTQSPIIRMPSTTGVNFEAVPLFEVERDPVAALTGEVPLDKLVQVTDLVGLKQTGYVDGRSYYGAVYYKEGVRYAGYFETAGQLIQVYDTLQESITAQVTTDPSAILRQGTDTNSNNQRLDIPGTLDELI